MPDWWFEIPTMIAQDARAYRRGVSVIIISWRRWQEAGCPLYTVLPRSDGTSYCCPVEPFGRSDDRVAWKYRRIRRRAWRPGARP